MKKYWAMLIFINLITGCKTLQLSPVDFAWPIETVLKVDKDAFVKEDRYSMKINVQKLYIEEFGEAAEYNEKTVRIIRNFLGTYFITAEGFKNVYLFVAKEGTLTLVKKIKVSDKGMQNPYFNQRNTHIELVDNNIKINLSNEGIIGDTK